MLDIGWSELLVIAVVTIVVVGPKDLPRMLRTVGRYMGTMRKMAGEFRSQFDQAMREAELADLQKEVQDLKKLNPLPSVKKTVAEAIAPMQELPTAIEQAKPATDPKPGAGDVPAPAAVAAQAPANDTAAPPPAPAAEPAGVASPARRSVAERAADAWKKAVGDEAGG